MYLARISIGPRKPADFKRAVLDGVDQAVRHWSNVDQSEIFLTLAEHNPADFRLNKKYVAERPADVVLIQVSISRQTDVDQSQPEAPPIKLFEEIANQLRQKAGVAKNDVLLTLVEVPLQNATSGMAAFNWIALAPRPVFKPRVKAGEASSNLEENEKETEGEQIGGIDTPLIKNLD